MFQLLPLLRLRLLLLLLLQLLQSLLHQHMCHPLLIHLTLVVTTDHNVRSLAHHKVADLVKHAALNTVIVHLHQVVLKVYHMLAVLHHHQVMELVDSLDWALAETVIIVNFLILN